MKKIANIIFSSVFFAACAFPLLMMPICPNKEELEKKPLAKKPQLIENGSVNTEIAEQTDNWFSDHLPFRAQLLTTANYTKSVLLKSSAAGTIAGSDGWIFSDKTLDSYIGANSMSEREISAAAVTLSLLQENMQQYGGKFLFFSAPDKNTVYPEFMPDNFVRTEDSELSSLYERLDEFEVNYLDMAAELNNFKAEGTELYHKRDTHWNYLGAFIGYNAIMNTLQLEHRQYEGAQYTIKYDWRADLDKMLYPCGNGIADKQYYFDMQFDEIVFKRPTNFPDSKAALADFMGDSQENDSDIIARRIGDSVGRDLYMMRDSFGRALLPYMIDNFDESHFIRATSPNMTEAVKSDVFIYEVVERNLDYIISSTPFMYAPRRDDVYVKSELQLDGNTAYCKALGYGIEICGSLDPEMISDNDRVYVRLDASDGTRIYEAFPICDETMMKDVGMTDIPPGGEGFSMYISPAELPAGEYQLSVICGNKSSAPLTTLSIETPDNH